MKSFGLFIGPGKPEAVKPAELTARFLIENDAECCAGQNVIDLFPDGLKEKIKPCTTDMFEKQVDTVISFGGDGTMLGAARELVNTGIPIMGFNVGKLGFLAEFSVNNLTESLTNILAGNYRVVDRTVIETTIEGETIYALNDAVIEKKDSSRMITIHAFANNNFIGEYRSDGLILTTPTGSTAYSLSCGGPILAPDTNVFCITPICPHSLTFRPLVIDDGYEITLKVMSLTGEVSFVADGQIKRTLKHDDSLIFKRSEEKIKLIKPIDSSYYDLLRNKLLWSASAGDNDECNDNKKVKL